MVDPERSDAGGGRFRRSIAGGRSGNIIEKTTLAVMSGFGTSSQPTVGA
jgi:hypothetical protein